MRPSRATAALVATTLGIAALAGTAGAAAAQTTGGTRVAGAPVTPVAWSACDEAGLEGYECATVRVPLDHDRPGGASIDIALLRAQATGPGEALGSLFLNPGGPGGSGVEIAAAIAPSLPGEIRERFDVVGFDPRGVARSSPLRCYPTFLEAVADLPPVAFPETPAQEDLVVTGNGRLADACRDHAGPILRNMSTADVARDLDLLRQAVGDDGLTYLGYSYGSLLGQTYANLFPDRVRSVVIDGVIDPRDWVGQGVERWTVPVATRIASAENAQRTLDEFFRLCDEAGPGCAFAGDAAGRFARLAERVRETPVVVEDPFGTVTVTYDLMIATTLAVLYTPATWPDFAVLLQQLQDAASAAELRGTLTTLRAALGLDDPHAVQEQYPNLVEASPGVACADTDNPRGYDWYREAADDAAQLGYFGRAWNWTWSQCAEWPAQAKLDRYEGPWDAWTANPVLVVGTRFDPATGYHGAQAVDALLPNSELVTYEGWGHSAFVLHGNACVDAAVTAYLLTSTTPAGGTVCQAQRSPFDVTTGLRSTAATSPLAPTTLPDVVRRALD